MSDASLKGKTVVLGVTGGIAAYKIPNVAHALAKLGADVHVLMTKNATEFIAPLVFETLTNNRCIVDTFDRNFQYDVAHVSLANKADLMLIAPATAAAMTRASASITFSLTASNRSLAVTKGTLRTKGTLSPASRAHSKVTSAPRSMQARATAQPILPVEWLVM